MAVQCGLVTDADLVDTGLTADQLVCAAGSLRDPVLELVDTMSADSTAEPDFGTLAALLSAVDKCGIDLNSLSGMDQLFGPTDGGALDPSQIIPEFETPEAGQTLSLDDLEQYLTQEQIGCLLNQVTPEDMQKLLESGEPPSNLFDIMATCQITFDQFLQGF